MYIMYSEMADAPKKWPILLKMANSSESANSFLAVGSTYILWSLTFDRYDWAGWDPLIRHMINKPLERYFKNILEKWINALKLIISSNYETHGLNALF